MRKNVAIFMAIIMLFALVASPSFASVGTKVNGIRRAVADINFSGTVGEAVSVDGNGLTFNLLLAGVGNGDATSMTTSDLAVPVGFSFVRKAISADSAFSAGTLADGKAGQLLTLYITEDEGSVTFVVTPATSTSFATASFDSVHDQATFLWTGSTNGWAVWNKDSVTVALP